MITRRTKLQLIAFAVVAVLGMSYLGFKYVGLDRVVLGTGYDVAADFKDSGGIFVNAEVTYRGVAVGRVSDMKLINDGVRVVLTMEPGADRIPASTKAMVATRSAVGEQYILLQPDNDKGPYLKDGSVIPKNRTSIPVPVQELLLNLDKLVGSLDQENLRIVVNELGKAFAGSGDDLGRLIDNGNLLLARAEQSLPQTLKLITDGQTVLATQPTARRSGSGPPACDRSPTRSCRSTLISGSWSSTRRTPRARSSNWWTTQGPGSARWSATSTSSTR
jgi:virulence factor Mce-like protein